LTNLRSALGIVLVLLVICLVIAGLTYANYRFSSLYPGGNDFLARWNGARYWLVQGISPYDEQVSRDTQLKIYGHIAEPSKGEDKNHFVYPLPSMLFFGLFGLLDYPLARALWMTTLELSLIGLAIVGLRLADWKVPLWKAVILLLFSMLWYHALRTIIIGQFAAINALLIALSLLLIKQKQNFVAGLVLSLSIAKPQMSFLIIPYILFWALSVKRWELWWGILSGIVIQMGVSLALMPDWPAQMLRQVLDYPSYTNIGSPLSIIANAMPGIGRQVNIFLHVIFLGYLLVEWVISWRKDTRHFIWTALMTLVITNMVVLRTATTNYVMLLPVLFYIFAIWEARWRIAGQFFMWLSLATLGIGLWVLFLTTVQGNVEQPIMYLPLPFFSLVGLWWVRWWAIRPPRLMVGERGSFE
jgi:Glycosyltransferase family 87